MKEKLSECSNIIWLLGLNLLLISIESLKLYHLFHQNQPVHQENNLCDIPCESKSRSTLFEMLVHTTCSLIILSNSFIGCENIFKRYSLKTRIQTNNGCF